MTTELTKPGRGGYRPITRKKWHTDQSEEFIRAVATSAPRGRVPTTELFRAYRAWCDETRETELGRTVFFAAVRDFLGADFFIKTRGRQYVAGIELRPQWLARLEETDAAVPELQRQQVQAFARLRLRTVRGETLPFNTAFAVYLNWTDANGWPRLSEADFKRCLRALGFRMSRQLIADTDIVRDADGRALVEPKPEPEPAAAEDSHF